VLYAGRVAEVGDAERVLVNPRHPYTAGLMRAVPRFESAQESLVPIPGTPPRPGDVGDWCPFAPRCPNVAQPCRESQPPLEAYDGRMVACYRPWGQSE
jgi:oligopeptide/dipeptide ABC transporter ATP-binding protein